MTQNYNTRLLTQKETALAIGVSVGTLSKWDDCPCVRIGKKRSVRYMLDDVLAYLKEKQQPHKMNLKAKR